MQSEDYGYLDLEKKPRPTDSVSGFKFASALKPIITDVSFDLSKI